MKWEPVDIIRAVALVGGFLLVGLGAWLMWLGVGADGAIDIKSSLLSGSIKTGSAGLFIGFFGCVIVLFVLTTLTTKAAMAHSSPQTHRPVLRGIGRTFKYSTIAAVACGLASAFGWGPGFGAVAGGLTVLVFFSAIAYMAAADTGL